MTKVESIIYTPKAAASLKPLDKKTLVVEAEIRKLDISPEGHIRGVNPLKSRVNGNKSHSGIKMLDQTPFILAAEGLNTVVVDLKDR